MQLLSVPLVCMVLRFPLYSREHELPRTNGTDIEVRSLLLREELKLSIKTLINFNYLEPIFTECSMVLNNAISLTICICVTLTIIATMARQL